MKGSIKLLMIDIETRPNLVHTWGQYNQNVGNNQVVEPKEVFSFAAEWYQRPYKHQFWSTYHQGEKQMAVAAFDLLDQADGVIHYNGKKFDEKHLNALFTRYRLGRPVPFTSIDLYQVVKKYHEMFSKKLQWVTEMFLEMETKEATGGHELWKSCLIDLWRKQQGIDEPSRAWAKMRRYNSRDVKIMRGVYETLLPWIDQHPNMNLFGGEGCSHCGEPDLIEVSPKVTRVSKYPQWRCAACGSFTTSGKKIEGVDLR